MSIPVMPSTETLAISPSVLHSANQHRAYQRLLLAHIGITPWVSQSAPVQNFAWDEIITQQNFPQKNANSVTLFKNDIIKTPDDTLNSSQNLQTNLQSGIGFSESHLPPDFANQPDPIATLDPPFLQNNENINTTDNTAIIADTCRYHIEAIVLPHWIFIADVDILQQDNRQLYLWQTIGRSMQANFYSLQFPIVTQPQHPQLLSRTRNADEDVQSFDSTAVGLGSFQGFINSLRGEGRQVGYLTPLSPVLHNFAMHRLPSLIEMVDNPMAKRELWHLIKHS